jgi:FAD/FMN-containing dehydrogenase
LKLFPKPRGVSVALIGLDSPTAALAVFHVAHGHAGVGLTACEIIPRIGLEAALRHVPGARDPLAGPHAWYLLIEVSSGHSQAEAEALVEAIFAEGLAKGLVEDGTQAQSLDQAAALWRLRHALPEVQKHEGGSIKHDVAVPIAAVPELIERASAAVARLMPGARPFPFGHLGDGNIHFNVSQPPDMDKQAFLDRWDEVNAAVHAVVLALGGTIAAEHGIGQLKRDLLVKVKSPVEMDLMRRLKNALDPNGILNPGKVL